MSKISQPGREAQVSTSLTSWTVSFIPEDLPGGRYHVPSELPLSGHPQTPFKSIFHAISLSVLTQCKLDISPLMLEKEIIKSNKNISALY